MDEKNPLYTMFKKIKSYNISLIQKSFIEDFILTFFSKDFSLF